MEKVKVIEFIQTMGDGGAETLVKDYALLMDRQRFDVTVVVQHAISDSANLQRLKEYDIPIHALSSEDDLLKRIWRKIFWKQETQEVQSENVQEKAVLPGENYEQAGFLRSCRNSVRNLFFGLKFLKILRSTGATVVHAHLDMLGCLQAVSPFLKGVKLFHTCHALPHLIYAGDEGRAARNLISKNRLQLVALHDDMAREMDEMFPGQKTVVIRNGVNMDKFRHPGITREKKRLELQIPADAFLVGHVGRFTPEKNHVFLVDVFAEIAARRPEAFLLMVGAGDTARVEEKLSKLGLDGRYRILSRRTDIPQLLTAMDVFVFPSIFEGFPVSVIEAQAAGLRCIVSAQIPSAVMRLDTCVPMPLEAPECWAQAALDPNRKRDSAQPLEDYDMNCVIRTLEQMYQGHADKR